MRSVLQLYGVITGVLLSLPVYAADKLFAAPDASSAAATSTATSLSKMTLALMVVLAFIFLAAWALKQTRKLQQSKSGVAIEIVAQVALGAKERAVLLQVGDTQVLVGVAPGQVNALHVMPAGAAILPDQATTDGISTEQSAQPALQSFQAVLKRSLGIR
jgi:flagellar protein FliO/FliZ